MEEGDSDQENISDALPAHKRSRPSLSSYATTESGPVTNKRHFVKCSRYCKMLPIVKCYRYATDTKTHFIYAHFEMWLHYINFASITLSFFYRFHGVLTILRYLG